MTFLRFQGKWFYSSCSNPRCKKNSEAQSTCRHCGVFNTEVALRYILPVEMSDFTGSLWTTAFDDFANDLFRGYSLHQLSRCSEGDLKHFAEKYFYRQFKVRLATKKEQDGVIRHMPMGKPA